MAVNSKHPDYMKMADQWRDGRVAYDGEEAVKAEGIRYLPPAQSMVLDGMSSPSELGSINYEGYLSRAVFHDFFRESVETHIGLLHSKEAVIELPDALLPLLQSATGDGASLLHLYRQVHEEQLVTGRLGLMLDVATNSAEPLPYIALYKAEHIINWDADEFDQGQHKLKMVVLDESGPQRVGTYDWKDQERYRILSLGTPDEQAVEPGAGTAQEEVEKSAKYQVAVTEGMDPGEWVMPMLRGQTLEQIPFVFINSKDLTATPDRPPLQGLTRLCFTIYRAEADYRQSLHMQGQDTLVIIGGTRGGIDAQNGDAIRVGAGAHIQTDVNGDAKFIGVSSQGLPEQRMALENDRQQARTRSGQVLPTGKSSQESGEALKTRIAAQTATMNQIALTSAAGLEAILKAAAVWVGANPDDVKVIPNLEFSNFAIPGQEFLQLMTAKTMGAPLSLKSLHELAVDRGLTKMDFEAEMELVKEEQADLLTGAEGTGADGLPAGDTNNDE